MNEPEQKLALALLAIYAWGAASWLIPKFFGSASPKLGVVAGWLVLGVPAIIPSAIQSYRVVVVCAATDAFFRICDYARHRRATQVDIPFRKMVLFLIPFPLMLGVFATKQRRAVPGTPLRDILHLLAGSGGFLVLLFTLFELDGNAFLSEHFWLDHALKVLFFVVAIECASFGMAGLERLAGFDVPPINRRFIASRSVGEFWWRYNNRVHEWLYRNVYCPCGGRRRPWVGMLAAFGVSAVFHEIMFAIATSRLTGFQFAFFIGQAPGCILTSRLANRARGGRVIDKCIAHIATITWFYFSSVLFFHGVDLVFPFFYSGESILN